MIFSEGFMGTPQRDIHCMVLAKVLAILFAPRAHLRNEFYRDFPIFLIFPPGPQGLPV